MDPGKEEKLITQCLRNNRKAQKEVYEYFFTRMFAICKRYLKNNEDAIEVLNIGMLTVFKKIDRFEKRGSFEGWVKRIITNKCLDFIKANKRYKEIFTPTHEIFPSALIEENMAMEELNMEDLYRLIRTLPTSQQTIFNLFAIEGYSHHEIAEKLNINASTSRWHLAKAREALQQLVMKKKTLEIVENG